MIELKNILNKFSVGFELKIAEAQIKKGELTAIIGANGCGKTTLLKVINGLIKPITGEIIIDDRDLNSYSYTELAKKITFMPQSHSPVFNFTVLETVLLGRLPYLNYFKNYSALDIQICEAALLKFEVLHLKSQNVKTISGGELQRVMLAKILAQETNYLLLDEPLTHLDPKHQIQVIMRLQEIIKEKNIGIVCTLHDINFALNYFEKVIAMKNGEILFQGKPEVVITEDNLFQLFGTRYRFIGSNSSKLNLVFPNSQ